VHHLDRILDRDDVRAPRPVDVADHRRDRRGLPRARRAGDEDETARRVGEGLEHGRQPQLGDRRHLRTHAADRETDRPALAEHVDTEPPNAGDRVTEVGLARRLELAPLVLGHQRDRGADGVFWGAPGTAGSARRRPDERHVARLGGGRSAGLDPYRNEW
jgi:hypothetical protein